MVTSLNAAAELSVKFGGWSKHFSDPTFERMTYNESHNGIGFDYKFNDYVFGIWHMTDSLNKDAFQIGMGRQYKLNEYMSFNLAFAYFDRSKVVINDDVFHRYEDDGSKTTIYKGWDYKVKRTNFVAPIPYLTVNITDRLNADLMIFIDPTTGEDGVAFFRLGYKFN